MNYTENYHLPQWVKSDRIMMDDFNQMCANMEAGMSANAQAAAQAQAKANAAYSPDQKPYVVGSYTGTGQQLDIYLGFRPSFLIISSAEAFSNQFLAPGLMYVGQTGGNALTRYITLTDTGFRILAQDSTYPHLGDNNRIYDYIAFR